MRPAHSGIVLSLSGAFLGAVHLVTYKAAGGADEPAALVLATLLLAAALNTVALGPKVTVLARARAIEWGVAAVLAVFTVVANLAILASLEGLNPAITSVLVRTQVLFVAALAWLVLGERLSLRFVAGAVLATAGFVFMRTGEGSGALTASSLWALVAAAAFALMQIVARRTITRIRPGRVNPIRLWVAVAGVALVPGAISGLFELGLRRWLLAGLAALAGPYLARLALLHALRFLSASHSTLLTLAAPLFAAALAFVVFGDVPTGRELAGASVLLAGVALPLGEMRREGFDSG
ncbi:EamA family transporter [Haliangium sp.]|uniref:EamA family transporter n=1 Tax=Haliangium sp. TaxID=2663208 RepID=UPI003D12DA04